jgi:Metal binding domain of Ada
LAGKLQFYKELIKMTKHQEIIRSDLIDLIKAKKINFGGNQNLKIYGLLTCKSGKRMKKSNRVFFGAEVECLKLGYRPCGSCLNSKYKKWKSKK